MFKPRLQRLKWLYTDRPVYFITTNTHGRRRLLDHTTVHKIFVKVCQDAMDRGVFVGRYVLMPDHLHLFAAFAPRGPRLSGWVQSVKVALAKTLRQRCSGELRSPSGYWQKGFFDHVLRSAESYAQKWEYVRQNPVRAHLVERPEDWPYQGEIHKLAFL